MSCHGLSNFELSVLGMVKAYPDSISSEIARQLIVGPEKTKEALQTLKQAGFVQEKEGKFFPAIKED